MIKFIVIFLLRFNIYFASKKAILGKTDCPKFFFTLALWSVTMLYWVTSVPVPAVVGTAITGKCPSCSYVLIN